MIRVLVVTEIELIGNVLATILDDEPDIEIVGCATSIGEALAQAAECDVVLISPKLPADRALELTTIIHESYPDSKILVFGLTESETRVLRYIEAGADGYVAKDDSVEDLLARIRAAYKDKAVVSPKIAAALVSRVTEYAQKLSEIESAVNEEAELTPREHEILELIAEGYTNPEIAERLVIEVGTVKAHVHSILQKLDVSTRQEAAAYLPFIE